MKLLPKLLRDSADARQRVTYARTLGAPRLAKSDGAGLTYAIDVALQGQQDEALTLPLAHAVGEAHYAAADGGIPVTVAKNPSTGKDEVVGFAKQMPGELRRFGFSGGEGTIGPSDNVGLTRRRLTFAEIGVYGTWGTTPWGAWGEFRGSTFLRFV